MKLSQVVMVIDCIRQSEIGPEPSKAVAL
jgi:hypothetical protein